MRNHCISTLKGIACILIVFIHCSFPGLFGEIIKAIARPAVFYFFMVSGFFVYSADESKFLNKVKRQFGKVLKMTVVCLVISFIWRILYAIIGDAWTISDVIKSIFNLQKFFTMFVFQEDIVLGPFWFLLALLMCYIAVYILHRTNLLSISPALIVITLVLNVYLAEFRNISLIFHRNFWLTGFPFYMMGYMLHRYWDRVNKTVTDQALTVGIVAGFIATILEYRLFGSRLIYIGSIILVISCFVYAIKNPSGSIAPLEAIGEKLSMYVYCSHWFVMEALATVAARLNLIGNAGFQFLNPLLTVTGALLVSYCIYILGNRKKVLKKNV